MVLKENRPIHPGEIIRNDYLTPHKVTLQQLAEAIGINPLRVSEILYGNESINTDTAFRLAKFFNTSADFWITLQQQVDMWDTLQKNMAEYENIKGIA